ncbi:MAG TPA: GerMN domain-containing protein [Fimbriimonadaceae bacterium]|nr:GerMN domain-containing protein [Fimbriimonadaceae bacterium]
MVALLLFGAVGVAAVGFYVSRTPQAQNVPPDLQRHVSAQSPGSPSSQPAAKGPDSARVLTPKSKDGDLTFDTSTEPVPEGNDPKVFALNRFLENTKFVPSNARAVGVTVQDGVAYVSFTEGMGQRTYGSSDEATIIQGICKTLAAFPEIQKVQFEIDGKPMDSIGNVDLSQPLDVNPQDGSATQTGA